MSKFIVNWHLGMNGKNYAPGKIIDLSQAEANNLGAVVSPVARAEAVSNGQAEFVAVRDFQHQGEKFKQGETYSFDSATALALGAERIRSATED